ncbi:MAG: cyclic nucleotide-binding domain-containing protein [Anaerolineales bacterium]|nr:cyclic nucleotide-binding domain-containing protein [Anaerolineales bacterium]
MAKNFDPDSISLFKGLEPEDIKLLMKKFSHESIPDDTIIFHQGGNAERLYVMLSGRVSIRFKPHDGETLHVADIKDGDVFGWSAALGRDVYTSCAITTKDSEVLSIRGEDLHELCTSNPEIGVVILEGLAAVIAERLRNTHKQVVELLWQGVNSGNNR